MATIPSFPSFPGITYPVKRSGPIFDTVVQDAVSGRSTAWGRRITPKWTWELAFEMLRSGGGAVEMATLAGFYASRYGRLLPFGYRDAEDFSATAQALGVGNGTTTAFQLVRTLGGFVEPVYLPDAGASITVAGTAKTLGTDYTLSDLGLVTFTAAPAAGAQLTWTGGFRWLCRFDKDQVDFENFLSGYWSTDKISFTSVIV